jgi:FkbM family methyltransferase
MNLTVNTFYQFIFDYANGVRYSRVPKFKGICRRVYQRLVKRLVRNRDIRTLIKLDIGEMQLLFSVTHSFPEKYLTKPLYATNLSRLCGYLLSQMGPIKVVDIGANVGDTAALIASVGDIDILCIEGNEEYHQLLRYNASKIRGAALELAFVGERNEVRAASVVSDGIGTTTLVYSDTKKGGKEIKFRTLEEILDSHPTFSQFKVLKIDTDGHDLPIICANIQAIKRSCAVIHMEYAPPWMPNGKDSQLDCLEFLSHNGYNSGVVYTSEGELLLEVNLGNKRVVRSLHEYFSRSKRYCDIVLFPDHNQELYNGFVKSEYYHMQKHFGQGCHNSSPHNASQMSPGCYDS